MRSIHKQQAHRRIGFMTAVAVLTAGMLAAGATRTNADDAQSVAGRVDALILQELKKTNTQPAKRTSDEDFLRRVTFDLTGTTPSPGEVTLFGLDPDSAKREQLIDRLLKSDDFATNWSRYWRDVIFTRATNMRAVLARGPFEKWMAEQLKDNVGWDAIATELITATGDVTENGQTALIFAQEGQASEIAAETSRIFLGIQIQCANCHDHPTDSWNRKQFHELAAFFPRIGVRRIQEDNKRSFEIVSVNAQRSRRGGIAENPERFFRFLDKNRNGKITKNEVASTQLARFFDRLLQRGDLNKDGGLSLTELKKLPPPMQNQPGRGSAEHFMPDLSNPSSQGTKIDPVFFATSRTLRSGADDMERRESLSKYLTSADNKWFAIAYVNRIWAEMLGEGFYMPIDDIGPEREARYPQVLKLLSEQFVAHDYSIMWLFRTIANTETYQRNIRARNAFDGSPPFASATPTRLRADQLYSALLKVLGGNEQNNAPRGRQMAGPYAGRRSPRNGFNQLFGFDPSTPQEDITGNVPQALFLMNSSLLNNAIRAVGNTRLSQILKDTKNDEDAIDELYLLTLAREPSAKEMKICLEYLGEVKNRNEAYEDLMWSLLNSSEFLSKR